MERLLFFAAKATTTTGGEGGGDAEEVHQMETLAGTADAEKDTVLVSGTGILFGTCSVSG